MPEDSVLPFFRRERLTDRRMDFAIPLADFFLNTPGSRSIASLRDCTRATHFRFPLRLTILQYMSGNLAVNSRANSKTPKGFHDNSPTFQRWGREFDIAYFPTEGVTK